MMCDKITLVDGWHKNKKAALVAAKESGDCWTGTVQEFWEKNQDMTFGEVRNMEQELAWSGCSWIGGGSTGCFTIISAL